MKAQTAATVTSLSSCRRRMQRVTKTYGKMNGRRRGGSVYQGDKHVAWRGGSNGSLRHESWRGAYSNGCNNIICVFSSDIDIWRMRRLRGIALVT